MASIKISRPEVINDPSNNHQLVLIRRILFIREYNKKGKKSKKDKASKASKNVIPDAALPGAIPEVAVKGRTHQTE